MGPWTDAEQSLLEEQVQKWGADWLEIEKVFTAWGYERSAASLRLRAKSCNEQCEDTEDTDCSTPTGMTVLNQEQVDEKVGEGAFRAGYRVEIMSRNYRYFCPGNAKYRNAAHAAEHFRTNGNVSANAADKVKFVCGNCNLQCGNAGALQRHKNACPKAQAAREGPEGADAAGAPEAAPVEEDDLEMLQAGLAQAVTDYREGCQRVRARAETDCKEGMKVLKVRSEEKLKAIAIKSATVAKMVRETAGEPAAATPLEDVKLLEDQLKLASTERKQAHVAVEASEAALEDAHPKPGSAEQRALLYNDEAAAKMRGEIRLRVERFESQVESRRENVKRLRDVETCAARNVMAAYDHQATGVRSIWQQKKRKLEQAKADRLKAVELAEEKIEHVRL